MALPVELVDFKYVSDKKDVLHHTWFYKYSLVKDDYISDILGLEHNIFARI